MAVRAAKPADVPATPVILAGTAGDDVLEGAGGHDHLTGGPGADKLDGKEGFDYTRYDDASASVVVSLLDPSKNTGDAKGDVFVSLQGVTGSAFDDELTGNDETNDLHGMGGNDKLFGLAGPDGLDGEDGDDRLDGGQGSDNYVGGPGADIFVFHKGEANGDSINDFKPDEDNILLVGYGPGATFVEGDRNQWTVQSKDGNVAETILVMGEGALKPVHFRFE